MKTAKDRRTRLVQWTRRRASVCLGCVSDGAPLTSSVSCVAMKIFAAMLLLVATVAYGGDTWKSVDEGFRMMVPETWQKLNVRGIDSHVGAYKSETTDLEFDEVFGLGYTAERAQAAIEEYKKKEANPKLLKPGEEIWHVGGRIARFSSGTADPKVYGKRRFSNVAELHVPYAGKPGYLSIYILYKCEKDLPTARRVLQSLEWKPKSSPKSGSK